MENRITWEAAANGEQSGIIAGESNGYKARTHVFSITFKPGVGTMDMPYILAHRLPFQQINGRFKSVKHAQNHAERYLVMAAELLNFSPIDKTELARLREIEARSIAANAELDRLVARRKGLVK